MADGKLRQLGREGSEQAVRLLQERVRTGDLSHDQVVWAARLGHPVAGALHADRVLSTGDSVARCLRDEVLSAEQSRRFAVRCVQRVLPLFARSLPSQVVPQALNALARGPSLVLDLASVLPNLPPLSQHRSSAVFQCYRALRAALNGDAPVAAQAALYARPADDHPEELDWQRGELAALLLE